MNNSCFYFTLAFLYLSGYSCSAPSTPINWPNNAKAAICLSYDDGMKTQLDNAIPQLNQLGMKGTFFLNQISNDSIAGLWKQVSLAGHELANHTVYHPCSRKMNLQNGRFTDDYTLDQMLDEIETMNKQLHSIDGKMKKRAFAYPCSEWNVGGQPYIDPLAESALVSYARGGGGKNAIIDNFERLDPFHVPSWGLAEGTTGKELIAFAQKALKKKGLGVYMFHGIGGQWISVSDEAHLELLQFLEANKKDFWVTTFEEAMRYIKPL